MKKKRLILAILLVIFIASLAYRIRHPYQQQKVSRLVFSGSRKRVVVKKNTRKGEEQLLKSPEVMLGLFSKSSHHHGEVIHNPFFEPSTDTSSEKKSTIVPVQHAEKTPEPAGEDPRARVQRDLSSFRVFGSCQGEGKNMLFLERGKDVFIVQPGDKIDGKYLIKSISGNSLDLWAAEIQQDIHIDLSDF
jgi:hypothetical protein